MRTTGPLSDKLRATLKCMLEGLTIEASAREQGITFHTAVGRRRLLCRRYNVTTAPEVIAAARACGDA